MECKTQGKTTPTLQVLDTDTLSRCIFKYDGDVMPFYSLLTSQQLSSLSCISIGANLILAGSQSGNYR